jgi:hypothetical protein
MQMQTIRRQEAASGERVAGMETWEDRGESEDRTPPEDQKPFTALIVGRLGSCT